MSFIARIADGPTAGTLWKDSTEGDCWLCIGPYETPDEISAHTLMVGHTALQPPTPGAAGAPPSADAPKPPLTHPVCLDRLLALFRASTAPTALRSDLTFSCCLCRHSISIDPADTVLLGHITAIAREMVLSAPPRPVATTRSTTVTEPAEAAPRSPSSPLVGSILAFRRSTEFRLGAALFPERRIVPGSISWTFTDPTAIQPASAGNRLLTALRAGATEEAMAILSSGEFIDAEENTQAFGLALTAENPALLRAFTTSPSFSTCPQTLGNLLLKSVRTSNVTHATAILALERRIDPLRFTHAFKEALTASNEPLITAITASCNRMCHETLGRFLVERVGAGDIDKAMAILALRKPIASVDRHILLRDPVVTGNLILQAAIRENPVL